MSKDACRKEVSEMEKDSSSKKAYRAPEMFLAGSSKQIIQGPMLNEYWDCIGNGKTLTRPNC
jgi:hypothetical protein